MEKLDIKDEKILKLLKLDALQTYKSIAKKVGLSKEVVRYRIHRLETQGAIDKHVLILNTKKFGYTGYKWYIELENTSEKKLQEIIQTLASHPFCAWLTSCAGKWDLAAVFLAESPEEFRQMTKEITALYAANIRSTTFTIDLQVYHFQKDKKRSTKTPYLGKENTTLELNNKDILILTSFCEDPTISYVELAKKTHLTMDIIRPRIKKLKEQGIIQGSRIHCNTEKLGLESYKILLKTKSATKEREKSFLTYLEYHKNVGDVILCLGNWDMEVNIEVRTSSDFQKMIQEQKSKYSDIIQEYNTVQLFENHKYNFFPMGSALIKSAYSTSVLAGDLEVNKTSKG